MPSNEDTLAEVTDALSEASAAIAKAAEALDVDLDDSSQPTMNSLVRDQAALSARERLTQAGRKAA